MQIKSNITEMLGLTASIPVHTKGMLSPLLSGCNAGQRTRLMECCIVLCTCSNLNACSALKDSEALQCSAVKCRACGRNAWQECMADQSAYKAAVWKRDLVSMLPRCTPNSSRLDSSKLLNTFPLETPVRFLFSAYSHGHCLTGLLGGRDQGGGEGERREGRREGTSAQQCCSAQVLQLDDHTTNCLELPQLKGRCHTA